jgi:hypothetical protein
MFFSKTGENRENRNIIKPYEKEGNWKGERKIE